jgi:hypothetical protein
VSRVSDHRTVIKDLENASQRVAARMGVLVTRDAEFVPA